VPDTDWDLLAELQALSVPLPLEETDTVELLESEAVLVTEGDRVVVMLGLLLRVEVPEPVMEALTEEVLLPEAQAEKEPEPELHWEGVELREPLALSVGVRLAVADRVVEVLTERVRVRLLLRVAEPQKLPDTLAVPQGEPEELSEPDREAELLRQPEAVLQPERVGDRVLLPQAVKEPVREPLAQAEPEGLPELQELPVPEGEMLSLVHLVREPELVKLRLPEALALGQEDSVAERLPELQLLPVAEAQLLLQPEGEAELLPAPPEELPERLPVAELEEEPEAAGLPEGDRLLLLLCMLLAQKEAGALALALLQREALAVALAEALVEKLREALLEAEGEAEKEASPAARGPCAASSRASSS
jgi:hypothetical protein